MNENEKEQIIEFIEKYIEISVPMWLAYTVEVDYVGEDEVRVSLKEQIEQSEDWSLNHDVLCTYCNKNITYDTILEHVLEHIRKGDR